MCGIAGLISKNRTLESFDTKSMLEKMAHRGPDDFGNYVDKERSVWLGHRRLSIRDLTSAGHQPMLYNGDNIVIVFNGEIYNFTEIKLNLQAKGHNFKTNCDTEIILASYFEWGENCVEQFDGMWSFAIYDKKSNRLFCSRDRAGEKPFYYYHNQEIFAFSSELLPLMSLLNNKIFDTESIAHYFAYGYLPNTKSMIRGISKLSAGANLTITIENMNLKLNKYWSLPKYAPESVNPNELAERLHELLLASVKKQLMADVPVGILLSGGVDSSLITAIASSLNSKLSTYSIIIPNNSEMDERKHAKLIADAFSTDHNELSAEDITYEMVERLCSVIDEPIADTSIIPTYMISKLIRSHAAVALGGDGADELFGGYLQYNWVYKQKYVRLLFPEFIRSLISKITRKMTRPGFNGRNFLLGLSGPIQRSYGFSNFIFDKDSLNSESFIRSEVPTYSALEDHISSSQMGFGIPGDIMAMDFKNYLVDDILFKVDRTSMLNSLEVRAPFLNYQIVEFAFSKIPNHYRATINKRKIIPKLLAKKLLPKSFDLSRKRGFTIPLSKIVLGNNKTNFIEIIRTSNLLEKNLINKFTPNLMVNEKYFNKLFSIYAFETWRKKNSVSI